MAKVDVTTIVITSALSTVTAIVVTLLIERAIRKKDEPEETIQRITFS